MGDLALNHEYKLKINTTPATETPTLVTVGEGFDNITEAINEVVYQASFLGDGGYGSSEVTGAQLILTLTGTRHVGDEAQDYIFSDATYYGVGKARKTNVTLETPDGSTISALVTLAKIARSGGAANGGTAVSVEIHFNGKPTITT